MRKSIDDSTRDINSEMHRTPTHLVNAPSSLPKTNQQLVPLRNHIRKRCIKRIFSLRCRNVANKSQAIARYVLNEQNDRMIGRGRNKPGKTSGLR